jgi:hypothetical protein
MTNGWLNAPFLWFLAVAFLVLLAAGGVTSLLHRTGRVAAGRATLLALWVGGSVALAAVGFAQYGYWSVPPAAIAAALSLLIVYAIAGSGAGAARPLSVGARVSIAAVLATAVLPVALLWSLAMLGIDGP